MEKQITPAAMRSLLQALRTQMICERLSDEDGKRLVKTLESILRELSRLNAQAN